MALICTAALAVASASAHVSAQTTLKDRVVSAIESVEAACADDINKFCGHVTRGEGRLLLCMQAHDDQLSFRCQFGLYRASRHLDNALNRVERIADACWGDIETQCKDAQSIGQCVLDKAPALSQACQTVVAGIRQALQGVASLKGLPAFSGDGKNLGQVVDVVRGPDGKVQSVRIDVGRFLGMGDRVVTINRGAFEQLADRINLRLSGDDVRALPESK
jgi:Golgi apparatus protein 1